MYSCDRDEGRGLRVKLLTIDDDKMTVIRRCWQAIIPNRSNQGPPGAIRWVVVSVG